MGTRSSRRAARPATASVRKLRAAARARDARQPWWRRPSGIMGLGAAVLAVAVVGWLALHHGSNAPVTPAMAAEAEANSGGPVRVMHGEHTVFHSDQPLPTAAAPRADGRYTVVWFSGTSCEFCAHMQAFANDSAAKFRDRLAFVEKSVDDDRADVVRFRIRGTPTFVVLDAHGKEVGRFGFQRTAEAFEAVLAQVPKPQG